MILSRNVNNKNCAPKLVFKSQILALFDSSPLILYPPFENSTTHTAILCPVESVAVKDLTLP